MFKKPDDSRAFKFKENILASELPGYITHYVLPDEKILAAYKTETDPGIFTNNKIVLFDSGPESKQIFTIFYKSISMIDLLFEEDKAYFIICLESGKTLNITLENLEIKDKVRLRILYTCISRIVSGLKLPKEDLKKLIKNEF